MLVRLLITALTLTLTAVQASADAQHHRFQWEVSITNLTPGQSFTPRLLATHRDHIELFVLGEPAGEALSQLAESGDTAPLMELLMEYPDVVTHVQTSGGLVEPGQTVTATVGSSRRNAYLSLAAMLIPTNDNFVALNNIPLPRRGTQVEYALAYDAGSEHNDQDCVNIPGPLCEGEGNSEAADDDEGYVHVGNGFHFLGEGVLMPARYDWNNPVAKITIRALR